MQRRERVENENEIKRAKSQQANSSKNQKKTKKNTPLGTQWQATTPPTPVWATPMSSSTPPLPTPHQHLCSSTGRHLSTYTLVLNFPVLMEALAAGAECEDSPCLLVSSHALPTFSSRAACSPLSIGIYSCLRPPVRRLFLCSSSLPSSRVTVSQALVLTLVPVFFLFFLLFLSWKSKPFASLLPLFFIFLFQV